MVAELDDLEDLNQGSHRARGRYQSGLYGSNEEGDTWGIAKALAIPVLLAVVACSAQPPPGVLAPSMILPAPGSGLFCLSRSGRPVGLERYTVRVEGERWIVEGLQRFFGELPADVEYQLVAELDGEAIGFRTRVELYGEHREMIGVRRGPWWELRGGGVGGTVERRIAWAPGTLLGFPSPLFEALMLARLGSKLGADKVEARGVLLAPPVLSPAVRQMAFLAKGEDAQGRRVAISPGEGLEPIAVWMANDQVPARVRRFSDLGPIDAIRTSSCAEGP